MAKFEQLKKGDVLSETHYYKVMNIKGDKVQIMNDYNKGLVVIDKEYVENYITTADQFTETKKVTRTEAANIFLSHPWIAMTVNFNKQVDEKAAREQLYELYANKGGKMISEADYKKKVNAIISSVTTGEERTMIGRHFGEKNEFGRVQFIDMEKEKDESKTYDTRYRQVDPRTINWMIIKGVKYEIK